MESEPVVPRPLTDAAASTAPRRPSRRYTIKFGVIGLVAVCVVPSIVAVALLVLQNLRLGEDAAYGEAALRAHVAVATIDRELQATRAALDALAVAVPMRLDGADQRAFEDRLRTAALPAIVSRVVLVDPLGRVRADGSTPAAAPVPVAPVVPGIATPVVPPVPGASNGTVPTLWPPVAATRAALPQVVALAQVPGAAASFAMGVPVVRNGETAYALYAVIGAPRLAALVDDQRVPDGWVATLVDGDGIVLARSRLAARFVGRRAVPALVEVASRRGRGIVATQSLEGRDVMTAFEHSQKSPWWVAVGAPRAVLLGGLARSTLGYGIAIALLFAVAIAIAFRLGRSMSRSVQGLLEPALALGRGRLVERPDTALVETDEVAQAMVDASQRLLEARHQAYHDPLTGLCNRALFDELVAHRMAVTRRTGQTMVVLAIDLDGFKLVNDRHGHAAGDVVLKHAAERIASMLRASDVVSRRGGDEFSVLLNAVSLHDAEQVAAKLLALLADPYPDVPSRVSASIGMAMYVASSEGLDALLERADRALYQAKHAGKSRFVIERATAD